MKDFLSYIHAELSRMTSIHKSVGNLSKEDEELRQAMTGVVTVLENYAEHSKDGKLFQINHDLEYSIYHMWVSFKAEAALKDAEENIAIYQ